MADEVKFFKGGDDADAVDDPIESMLDEHIGLKKEDVEESASIEANDDESAAAVETEGEAKQTKAYIDRIEEVEEGESKAVLYIGDDTETMIKLVLPISMLPDGAWEGDEVLIAISIDNAEDAASTEEE